MTAYKIFVLEEIMSFERLKKVNFNQNKLGVTIATRPEIPFLNADRNILL